jgi:hypothetical protein
MSEWLIAACGFAYLLTAADLALRGQYGLALTFAAYALANVGLWLSMK